MDVKRTSVIMIYDDYWLLGTMPTRENRVLDVLKDTNSDYVLLNDVQVFRNETRVLSISQGVVAKQKLSLILIPGKDHEAPKKRSLLLMKKNVCRACVLVPGYTLQGNLYPTRIDTSLLTLTTGVDDFFPLTEATVSGAGIEPLQVPVAIVNNRLVTVGEKFQGMRVVKIEPNQIYFDYKGERIPLVFRRY